MLILINIYNFNIYNNSYIIDLLNNNNNHIYNKMKNFNDFFKISMYKSYYELNNYMFIIKPQNYHFFIENNKLIYHPNNNYLDGILRQYYCDIEYELAYNLSLTKYSESLIPKVICHRKLNYLKKNIYNNKCIYYKTFDSLQNPINAIYYMFNDILKNDKV